MLATRLPLWARKVEEKGSFNALTLVVRLGGSWSMDFLDVEEPARDAELGWARINEAVWGGKEYSDGLGSTE
jgi:hypothetical protein